MRFFGGFVFALIAFCSFSASGEPIEAALASGHPAPESPLHRQLQQFLRLGPANLFWAQLPELRRSQAISEGCLRSLDAVLDGERLGQQWAYKIREASAGSLDGLLDSVFQQPGDYDQCLELSVPDERNPLEVAFRGQYFMINALPAERLLDRRGLEQGLTGRLYMRQQASIQQRLALLFRFPKYFHLNAGVCMPSTCSRRDLQGALNETLERYSWQLLEMTDGDVKETFSERTGRLQADHPYAWRLLSAFVVLLCGLNVADLLRVRTRLPGLGWLVDCASIRRNYADLTKKPSPPVTLKRNQLFQSMRFTSTFMVLFGHVLLYAHCHGGYTTYNGFWAQMFSSESFVPILFILAGEATGSKLSEIARGRPSALDLAKELLIRALRFVPTIGLMVLLEICLPYFYGGPMAKQLAYKLSGNCARGGWRWLLLTQNYVQPDDFCIGATWSIAAEFQMLIVACALTFVYSRWPRAGLALNLTLIVGGWLMNFFTIWLGYVERSLVMQIPLNLDKSIWMMQVLHLNSAAHLYSYFLIFLVVFQTERGLRVPFAQCIRNVIACVLQLALFVSLFTGALFATFHLPSTPLNNALVFTANRSIFPLLAAWMLLTYNSFREKPELLRGELVIRFNNRLMGLNVLPSAADVQPNANQNPVSTPAEQVAGNEPIKESKVKQKSVGIYQILFRLMRSIYLSHHFLLIFLHFSAREPLQTDPLTMILRVQNTFLMGIAVAFVFHLLVDAPLSNLAGILIHRLKRSQYRKQHGD